MTHKHSVYDTDTHFIIDPKTRTFSNESSLKTLVVKNDINSERFTFELPRLIDGHDMSLCNKVEIHYINIENGTKQSSKDVYDADDLQVSPEDDNIVIFSWLLRGNATKYNGTLSFSICFKCLEADEITYSWNTLIYSKLSVGESYSNTEDVVQEYSDVLEKWKLELIEAGTLTDEDISGAVNDYMSRNPISLSSLEQDEEHRLVTDTEKLAWNGKSDFSGNYEDLANKPTIPREYTLPIATPTTLGGVKPIAKTDEMTQVVGIDELGGLFTREGVGIDEETLNQINKNTEDISKLSDSIANLNGGTYSSIEPSELDIPRVFFDEPIPQTKTDVKTKFKYFSKTKEVSGYAKFKAQGNSSLSYPKKNVTVKMYEDEACENKLKVDFKGWGKQNKHVYKANWVDLTHARNIVSARIWADIVKSRSDYENYPSEFKTSPNQGAVDGFPIKVYSKGIYQGRYTLNIPKDAWTFNMDKDLDNHCILCSEGYVGGCFKEASVTQWTDEVHDKMPTSINTRWIEIINFVMNSSDSEFKNNLPNYFYVDSLIDYLIYGVVSCGLDAFGKNQIYATYDGFKWIASMYDMDWTWGLHDKKFEPYDYPRESFEDYKSNGGNLLYIRLAQLFVDEIKARYEELKTKVLTIPYLINQFERFTDITPLDLVKEDYATTTGTGNFNGIPLLDSNNIQQIRDYIINRFTYADTYIGSLTDSGGDDSGDTPTEATLTSINATYNGSEVVVGTNVDDLMGITVVGTYSDGSTKNIIDYTLSGTINEGSNTITVSYQGKSTTFTVVGYVEEVEIVNLLDGVTYTYGQEPNGNTGVVTSVSGQGMFDKVTLPNDGRYLFEVTGQVPSLYLYDENDKYVGVLYYCGSFIAKAGWKVVCKFNAVEGTDYSSVARLVRYTTNEVQETISIDLSNRTWEAYGKTVMINISDYGVISDNIVSSNIPLHIGKCDGNIPNGELVGSIVVSGSITRLYFYNRTVDQITTYFAENPTTLVLNG